MRIGLGQIDPTIGDFARNCEKICQFVDRARSLQCDLVVFPELALVGYPPRDLLERNGFVENSRNYWPLLEKTSEGMGVLVGAVAPSQEPHGKPFHNSALFFGDGRLLATIHKRLLPSYDVFDEERYFEPGRSAVPVDFKGLRIGVTICEDVWNVDTFLPRFLYHCDPVQDLVEQSVDLIINLSASPYHVGKAAWVGELLRSHALHNRVPMIYVNQVGGNDELIFQGKSMVWDAQGQLLLCGPDFQEELMVFDSTRPPREIASDPSWDAASEVTEALVLGLRDYAAKCGFKKAVLGLSGGIDSAVTACLAAMALGPENVQVVAMPGPYNAPESLDDARELAIRLGVRFEVVAISRLFDCAREALAPVFGDLPMDVTEENLQARLRGLILMAFSNKFNQLLLNTGNKSELAVGYCTLYGDMNGGLSVLGDVPKTMVYAVARHLNDTGGWIPERILTRPPSAELRPDQQDQDSLPPYSRLDAVLAAYIERRMAVEDIVALGYEEPVVRWIVNRVDCNEYKRWQAPPVLRVTTKAFGIGRRFPIAHKYRP